MVAPLAPLKSPAAIGPGPCSFVAVPGPLPAGREKVAAPTGRAALFLGEKAPASRGTLHLARSSLALGPCPYPRRVKKNAWRRAWQAQRGGLAAALALRRPVMAGLTPGAA